MTKKELKEEYLKWNRNITALDDRKTEIFHKLQDMCYEKGDGKRWCGIEALVEALTMNGHIYPAMHLVNEYYKICGAEDALRNLAIATNNFE